MTETSKTPITDDLLKDVSDGYLTIAGGIVALARRFEVELAEAKRSLSDATSDLDNARENWNGFIDPINTFCTGEPDFVIRHEGGPREAAQNVIDFIKARGDYAGDVARELDRVLRQNECDMVLTGDEIRRARAVLARNVPEISTIRAEGIFFAATGESPDPPGNIDARISENEKSHSENGAAQAVPSQATSEPKCPRCGWVGQLAACKDPECKGPGHAQDSGKGGDRG